MVLFLAHEEEESRFRLIPSRGPHRLIGKLNYFLIVHRAQSNNTMVLLTKLKQRARNLKSETFALYLAARHPRTPWYAKLLAAGIVAYAFSPIDLIPDFIPILGYLDDLILIPLGIALVIKLVPAAVFAECRVRAEDAMRNGKPVNRVAAAVIITIWISLVVLFMWWAYRAFVSA